MFNMYKISTYPKLIFRQLPEDLNLSDILLIVTLAF